MKLRTYFAGFAIGCAAWAAGFSSSVAQDVETWGPAPGKVIYDENCKACHEKPAADSRAAPVATLRKMSAESLIATLTTGKMKPMGDKLDPEEMRQLVAYLALPATSIGTGWIDDHRCKAAKATVDLSAAPAQVGFGVDQRANRRMSAEAAGLKTEDFSDLEVAWTLALPGVTSIRSGGVVVGETVFLSAGQARHIMALDVGTGCVKWATATPSAVNNTLAFGRLGTTGRWALVAGGDAGELLAFDARTGEIVWNVDPRHDKSAPLSGSPLFAGDNILVPISATDVIRALDDTYACCQTHGDLVAVDAATGAIKWTWHATEPAKKLGVRNSKGIEMMGPSGAPIWSSPAYDASTNTVYAATGENNSPPATLTSDAIVALDGATGRQKWIFQGLADDIWHSACPLGPPAPDEELKPNCFFADKSVLRDFDFGGGPIVVKDLAGRDLILAGQKSGDLWALDATTGKLVWNNKFGEGTALGGIHWGIATDGVRVFAPVSDRDAAPGTSAAGVHAVDIVSGKISWQWKAEPDCHGGRRERIPTCEIYFGFSAAPLVVDGALVAGSLDGRFWAFDAATGKVLNAYDTARPFSSVNGVAGSGGSIDAAGVFAGSGHLFVNSGYAWFGQQAGNVIIAYKRKSR